MARNFNTIRVVETEKGTRYYKWVRRYFPMKKAEAELLIATGQVNVEYGVNPWQPGVKREVLDPTPNGYSRVRYSLED